MTFHTAHIEYIKQKSNDLWFWLLFVYYPIFEQLKQRQLHLRIGRAAKQSLTRLCQRAGRAALLAIIDVHWTLMDLRGALTPGASDGVAWSLVPAT